MNTLNLRLGGHLQSFWSIPSLSDSLGDPRSSVYGMKSKIVQARKEVRKGLPTTALVLPQATVKLGCRSPSQPLWANPDAKLSLTSQRHYDGHRLPSMLTAGTASSGICPQWVLLAVALKTDPSHTVQSQQHIKLSIVALSTLLRQWHGRVVHTPLFSVLGKKSTRASDRALGSDVRTQRPFTKGPCFSCRNGCCDFTCP